MRTSIESNAVVVDAGAGAPDEKCLCGSAAMRVVHEYRKRPAGETAFARLSGQPYQRQLLRCDACGHMVSRHDMALDSMYEADYMTATYGAGGAGGAGGLRAAFDRIIALDPARSDNVGRVREVCAFADCHLGNGGEHSVLDVGSGLCVFLNAMKAAGWRCVALDPDIRAVEHAKGVVGVDAVCCDYMKAGDLGRFDVISLNKVLEHVVDPISMLAQTRQHLRRDGFVYVEVPDGEAAFDDGPDREEFFIEHLHVFSMASLMLMITRAGLISASGQRVREPSGKYTLRAFCVRRPDGVGGSADSG